MKLILSALLSLIATGMVWAQHRIEHEYKLTIPSGKSELIWTHLKSQFATSATFDDENFQDTYYDTDELELLTRKSALRRRMRERKNARSLVQWKLPLDASSLKREEVKFEVKDKLRKSSLSTLLSVVIKDSDKEEFAESLKLAKVKEESLSPVLTLNQRRRRVYLQIDGKPFMTISLDDVKSTKWFMDVGFSELEIELNEKAYTDASSEQRAVMEAASGKIKDDLLKTFPLAPDQTSKYEKTIHLYEEKIPFFRALFKFFN